MLFAEMSDTVALAIVALVNVVTMAVLGIISTLITEWLNQRRAKVVAEKVEAVAAVAAVAAESKAEEVKTVLREATAVGAEKDAVAAEMRSETLKVAHVIHGLVNSEMHLALEAAAILARRLANAPDATFDDQATAAAAEAKLQEHDANQRAVDAKGGSSRHRFP